LSGIDYLASEIFEIPANLTHAQAAWGVTSAVENPQFSTAIGLVKFAQVMHTDRPARGFGRFIGKIFTGKR
jgi:cell division protein FtsA